MLIPQQRLAKMRIVMLPRLLRPRLLVLPLVLGTLVAPAFLTTSSVSVADAGIRAGTICKNVPPPAKQPPPRTVPSCVNCRAPLLNAPLAQADRETSMPPIVALPPAA